MGKYISNQMKKLFFSIVIFFLFFCSVALSQNNENEHVNRIRLILEKYFSKHEHLSVYLHLDRNFYFVGDTIWFSSYLINANTGMLDTASRIVFLDFIDEHNRITNTFLINSKNGVGQGSIISESKLHSGNWQLVAYTLSMKNFSEDYLFRKNIFLINSFDNDSAIAKKYLPPAYKLRSEKRKEKRLTADFFLQSGPDDNNFSMLVKVNNKLGKPSLGKGLAICRNGSFPFQTDVSGYAEILDLPLNQHLDLQLKGKKYQIKAENTNPYLRIILDKKALSFITHSDNPKHRFLLHLQNAQLLALYDLHELNLADVRTHIDSIPEGLNSFILLSQSYDILAEQHYFKPFEQNLILEKKLDKLYFRLKLKEKAYLSVSVFGVPQTALNYFGSIQFSLAYDQAVVHYHNPLWKRTYTHQPKTNYKLIFSQDYKVQEIDDLNEIFLSGKVVRFTNIGVADKIVRLSNSEDYFNTQEKTSGNWGKFTFDPVNMIDSAYLLIDAVRESGSNWLSVQLDTIASLYPKYNSVLTIPLEVNDFRVNNQTKENAWIIANSEMEVMIKKRNQLRSQSSTIYGTPDHVIKVAGTRFENYTSLLDVLVTVPGITMMGNIPVIRGISTFYGSIAPLVLLDNTPVSVDILTQISPFEVERIDVLKSSSNTSMFGSRGGNGVIAIITKQGELNTSFAYHVSLPGFAQMREFLITPPHASKIKQQKAYTLFWNPMVLVSASGEFEMEAPNYFQGAIIRIEGISESGKAIFFQEKL